MNRRSIITLGIESGRTKSLEGGTVLCVMFGPNI